MMATLKTVLIVEDSVTQAESLRAMLEEKGLKVFCALDGLSGLERAQQLHPDLIIMDVHMPGMNGFEVAQALKDDRDTFGIPIVMLTSSDTPEAALMGLDAGAIDYIPKDVFATSVLLETVRQMGLI
jgi:twitching motility two-component system response regulator PilH